MNFEEFCAPVLSEDNGFLTHKVIYQEFDIDHEYKRRVFETDDPFESRRDLITPIIKGKDWLFDLTCKHQPRTGRLFMEGGPIFIRAMSKNGGGAFSYDLGIEVNDQVVVIERGFWGSNRVDPGYQEFRRKVGAPEDYDGLPEPIWQAYYGRFSGLNIPDDNIVGIYPRLLPLGPLECWDACLDKVRGYKKKYVPWLVERIPSIPMPKKGEGVWGFRCFLNSRPVLGTKEGDHLFFKSHEQDGVIYHLKDMDVENMRILSDPVEAIDRYCEHVLLQKPGRFDFLPYTTAWI